MHRQLPHTEYISDVLEIMPPGCTLTVAQIRTMTKSLAGLPDWREANGTGAVTVRLRAIVRSLPNYKLNYSPRGGALLGVTRER